MADVPNDECAESAKWTASAGISGNYDIIIDKLMATYLWLNISIVQKD